ncbi:MAG: hypothetical protein Q8J74_06100 [Candidatus Didemnitutus sp.]|nr:hypothetical protein [Candidatus Didemnitutus sp.]
MKMHDHADHNKPDIKPRHDEVAKKADAIDEKEGRPEGHADQNGSEAERETPRAEHDHPDQHEHHGHHAHMAADFRKRFWISLVLTLPILLLSPMLQALVGLRKPSVSRAMSSCFSGFRPQSSGMVAGRFSRDWLKK